MAKRSTHQAKFERKVKEFEAELERAYKFKHVKTIVNRVQILINKIEYLIWENQYDISFHPDTLPWIRQIQSHEASYREIAEGLEDAVATIKGNRRTVGYYGLDKAYRDEAIRDEAIDELSLVQFPIPAFVAS